MKARTELLLTGVILTTSTIGFALLSKEPGWHAMKYPMVVTGFLGLCTAVVSGCYAAAGGMGEVETETRSEPLTQTSLQDTGSTELVLSQVVTEMSNIV